MPLGFANGRSFGEETKLLATFLLVYRRAYPGLARDRNFRPDELVQVEQTVERHAHGPSGKVIAAGIPAEPHEHPSNVYPATAGCVQFIAAAHLVSVDDAVDLERDVHRRVHRKGRNFHHVIAGAP